MDSKTDSQSSGLGMWTTPSLSGLMEHLNGLCQKIQFTVEMEENNQLPYLDVLVHRDEDTLTTSVYRCTTRCTHVKRPTPLEVQKCMVYRIPCKCGSVYIGETVRQLKTCITKHKKAVINANPKNAIAVHVWNTGHNIQWSETSDIDCEENGYRRRIKKALYIRGSANTINTDPGLFLNPCWAAC